MTHVFIPPRSPGDLLSAGPGLSGFENKEGSAAVLRELSLKGRTVTYREGLRENVVVEPPQEADSETKLSMQGALGIDLMEGQGRTQDG